MARQKIRAVALDLEGTLIDLEGRNVPGEGHFGCFIQAALDCGYVLTFEQITTHSNYIIGGGDQLVAAAVAELCGGRVRQAHILELKQRYFEQYLRSHPAELRPGAIEVIERLRDMEIPIGIGSLTDTKRAECLIKATDLDWIIQFNRMVFQEDVVNIKPHPEVWIKLAEKLEVSPEELLVFEDSNTGIEAARRAGCRHVAMPVFQTHANMERLVEAGATRIYGSWRELDIERLIQSMNEEN